MYQCNNEEQHLFESQYFIPYLCYLPLQKKAKSKSFCVKPKKILNPVKPKKAVKYTNILYYSNTSKSKVLKSLFVCRMRGQISENCPPKKCY